MWEPIQQQWEDRFADLMAYWAKYGDCNVPQRWPENPRLSAWVRYQRRARKQNILTEDHISRLDKIGFVWTMENAAWESKYAALMEYKKVHGHCRVPIQSREHRSLGTWGSRIRRYKRQGKLSEERIRRLDELGFLWEVTPYGSK
jgi:hypothetical protein